MTVEQTNKVDLISVDPKTDEVVMTISDHLDWADKATHLLLLQEKINSYLAFIESGEILDSYPNAKGRPVVIDVVFKHEIDPEAGDFLAIATEIVEAAGFRMTTRTLD
ncbi:DUF6572 domain-containing protein [Massilia soli]|uniref:Uncharacterized protein n=1 Tax=Massilia soli TaxID=2792854 RepID=A0ABS7SI90_9BURK|nr:DUF6572 domain-containing protein [Massilia soli]MBZ2205926.1 hypothetical protein [Massilia soli]